MKYIEIRDIILRIEDEPSHFAIARTANPEGTIGPVLLSDIFHDPLSTLQPNAHFPRRVAAYFDAHHIHTTMSFATN